MEHFTFTDASKGSIEISGDNKTISVAGDCEFGNAFGNNTLLMNANIIYNYIFKINELSDTIYLGIINENSISKINGYQPFTYNGFGLALRDDGHLYSPQGTINNDPYYIRRAVNGEFKAGDIVKMTLDTVNKQLIFNINGDNNNITLNINDDSNDNYRMAAYLYGSEEYEQDTESSITLSSYTLNIVHHKQEPDKKLNDEYNDNENEDEEHKQHDNDNDEKLENIIKSFTQILENKDRTIQDLQQKNHHQHETITMLQGENNKLQELIDDLKEGFENQAETETSNDSQTNHEQLQSQSQSQSQPTSEENSNNDNNNNNNNNDIASNTDSTSYGYPSLYSPCFIPIDDNEENEANDNNQNEENEEKEENKNTNDSKE